MSCQDNVLLNNDVFFNVENSNLFKNFENEYQDIIDSDVSVDDLLQEQKHSLSQFFDDQILNEQKIIKQNDNVQNEDVDAEDQYKVFTIDQVEAMDEQEQSFSTYMTSNMSMSQFKKKVEKNNVNDMDAGEFQEVQNQLQDEDDCQEQTFQNFQQCQIQNDEQNIQNENNKQDNVNLNMQNIQQQDLEQIEETQSFQNIDYEPQNEIQQDLQNSKIDTLLENQTDTNNQNQQEITMNNQNQQDQKQTEKNDYQNQDIDYQDEDDIKTQQKIYPEDDSKVNIDENKYSETKSIKTELSFSERKSMIKEFEDKSKIFINPNYKENTRIIQYYTKQTLQKKETYDYNVYFTIAATIQVLIIFYLLGNIIC